MELLTRFRERAPVVRAATAADLPQLVHLALAFCRERGRRTAPDARERLARFAAEFLASEHARVLVTGREGQISGMVWCQVGPPDLWDNRPVYLVDWLYVVPEARAHPRVALALLRGAVAYGLALGARRARITVDAAAPRLLARYQRAFGFAPETVILSRDIE